MELNTKNLKNDFFGGLISSLVALPLTLACGVLLFKGLHDLEMYGINAAIYTAIIGTFISAFIGNHQLQISGPRVATTLILSSFLLEIFTRLQSYENIYNLNELLIVFMILTVLLMGVFQLIFAYFNLGKLIKFLPSSVKMGVSTTIGLIIIFKQVPIIFNYQGDDLFQEFITNPLTIITNQTTLLFIAICIFIVLLLFKKDIVASKIRMIVPLLAPVLGGVVFYLFINKNPSDFIIGKINITLPSFELYFNTFTQNFSIVNENILEIIIAAFVLALMGSLSSLLSISVLEDKQKVRSTNPSIELKGQAFGNIISAFFAGMPSAGSEARGLSNYNSGGRTFISVIFHALFLIVFVFFLDEYIALIPQIVLSSLLVHTGIVMILPLIKLSSNMSITCLRTKTKNMNECLKDIFQTVLVVIVMLIAEEMANLTIAIITGFAMASLLFIYEMMSNTNYNIILGNKHHSRRVRTKKVMTFLKNKGSCVKIIELEGAIFFGTADFLRTLVSDINKDTSYIILDFRKVSEVDITGAEKIKLCAKENSNIEFSFSHIRKGDDTYQALCAVGLIGVDGLPWFENTDLALEKVENKLLEQFREVEEEKGKTLNIDSLNFTKNLSKEEQDILLSYMISKEYKEKDELFTKGMKSDELFFLRKGTVSIMLEQSFVKGVKDKLSKIRRITFSTGVVIGEMAFFEDTLHSVDALANEDVSVYILSRYNLDLLSKEHPILGRKLMYSFCAHLSNRLREVTSEIQVLERWS